MDKIDYDAIFAAAMKHWPDVNPERTRLDIHDENRWESDEEKANRLRFEQMVREGLVEVNQIVFSPEDVDGWMLAYNKEHDRLMLYLPKVQKSL